MTSMADCIARGVDFGEIDKARGVAAIRQYDQLVARYSSIMNAGQAAGRAAADMKVATAKMKTQRFHKVINQLQAMRRIKDLIDTAPDPAAAVRNLLEHSEGSGFRGESVRSLTEALESSINASIKDTLDAVGLTVTGSSRNKPLLLDLIRELHSEATSNPTAKALAKGIRTQQQRMRRSFNAHGGDIGDLSDFGVSHAHDAAVIRERGFDDWATEIETGLAWDRIVNTDTGQPFASAPGQIPPRAETARFLQQVFEGVTTSGWNKRDAAMSPGGKALYNQRAEHRVLHFKDGSAWLKYNEEFGTSDPFSAMMNGLHGLARDVALMRVLGPNPNGGLEFAAQVAKKRAEMAGDAKMSARVDRQTKITRAMLAHQTGATSVPEHIAMARFFGGVRSVLTSIQLGSAVISSVSDVATITGAAQAVGMSASNVLATSVKLTASHATRETAARMGYVAATLADAGAGSARYFGKQFGTGLPDRLAGFTLRATGLNFVTDMRKVAFQMEFSGFMADNAARDFASIDAPLRQLFENRGITARDWDLLRDPASRFREPGGADFIAPLYWLEAQNTLPRAEAEGLAMRLQAAILEQVEYAIPTASLEGRATLMGESTAGSIGGELLRSGMMYKSFSMSLMLNQYRRFAALDTRWDKVKYAAKMSAMMFALGGLAVQLKELVKGNDPRPMDDGKFAMAALFQGGGLGIFGDFFAAESNRIGGGLGETLAGPVVGMISDVVKPVASNITRAVKGEETLIGRDVAGLVRRNMPFLSSAWYARTAYSRLVADEIQGFLDPEADMIFRRRIKQQARDYGTQPYIPQRGSNQPIRMPDFSNALGGR